MKIFVKRIHALPQLASVFGNRTAQLLVGRYGASLISKERERFERALLEAGGNRDNAASLLGVSRATYFRRAKELGLVRKRIFSESKINL